MLLQIIGQICAFDSGYLSLTYLFGVNFLHSQSRNLTSRN